MRRLYVQILLTVTGSLLLFALLAGILTRSLQEFAPPGEAFSLAGELALHGLPAAQRPADEQTAALARLRARANADLALYTHDAKLIAAVGAALPAPRPDRETGGRLHGGHGAWALRLPDGRWLVARAGTFHWAGGARLLVALGLLAIAVAIAAYPVARRITRRVERLQSSVEALGSGDLSARVKVEGCDEVAKLAASFNRAAARIESLVASHKTLLANASHELRSPLARMRMAIDLAEIDSNGKLRSELERNIAELDQLIEEVLLASRLDAVPAPESEEEIDLLALAAEECARAGAELAGEPIRVRGERRLLGRMIRNLLENARRHGGLPIEVSVAAIGETRAELRVCDRGPGVPESERERIFTPFYRLPGASEREGGFGLGLALVRQIAERHRGVVKCEPRAGGGTCFVVTLPRDVFLSSSVR